MARGPVVTAAAKVLLGVLTVLALAAIVLEQGAWTRKVELPGPPERERSPESRAFFLPVGNDVPLACCLEIRSDSPDHPYQSDLKLSINGQPMGPPHTAHVFLRRGETTGYSHWSGYVFFAPPNGLQSVHAFVEYSIQPTRLTLWLLVVSAISLWLVIYRRAAVAFAAGPGQSIARAAVVSPYWIALGVCYAAVAAVALFAASTAYAWATGWALPTTALLRWSEAARWIAGAEPRLGQVLVAYAALGALATWIALFVPGGQQVVEREEARLLRVARIVCLPVVVSCLIFSMSAMWSGMVRPGDLHGSAIGGLIAFSDASNYIGEAYDQARDGVWRSITVRRPVAGAFRSLLLLSGGYSLPLMLVIQIVVLSAAMCFAAIRIARWRGVWAALAFSGLTYTYIRSFAPTTLTEPLGLIWGFLSLAFLVTSLQTGSRAQAIFGMGATALSLMTRMGSMFAAPALVAWIAFRRGERRRLQALALAIAAGFSVIVLSFTLSKLYSGGQEATGNNFSYTACGLAIGTDWTGCPQRFVREGRPLPDDVKARDAMLYRMAIDNVEAHPMVLVTRLAEGAGAFVGRLPEVAWRSYDGSVLESSWFPSNGLSILGLIGVVAVLYRRREPNELTFWMWMIAAILVSAPFVYFDDGRRVLATSYILLYAFFAIGFSTPTRVASLPEPGIQPRPVILAAVGAAILLLAAPAASHAVYSRVAPRMDGSGGRTSDYWLWGHRVTGFLVVADDAPLARAVPSVHVSDFAKMIAPVETYQGVIHPQSPPLPFAFVYAPRLLPGKQSEFDYIAPPAVLESRNVNVWHLVVEDWERPATHGAYWFHATDAAAVK